MQIRHKKLLRRNIIFVFSLLVGALFTVFVYGWIVLNNYHRQVDQNVASMVEFYADDINKAFGMINTQILNLLLGNTVILKEIPSIEDISSGHGRVEMINAQNDLSQLLYEMTMGYGDGYNMWFYNRQHDIYCDSGNGDYVRRNDFKDYISGLCRTDQMTLTRQQQWFLVDTGNVVYAVSAYQMGENYAGCGISVQDLIDPLLGLNMVDRGEIYIKNAGSTVFQTYKADGTMETKVESQAAGWSGLSALNLKYADFMICIMGTNTIQKQVFIYQSVLVVLMAAYVIFMLWMIHFTRRAIIQPLLFFSKGIESFKNTGSFGSGSRYEEFEEAGRLLQELEEKIQELEVSIYEERIERQKVELDYAQLQIRPHFYINCMNNIYSLAQMKRFYEIQDLSIYVSNYLRGIFQKGMAPVPLYEEIESIRNYMKIHKILYRNGFEYQLSVEDAVINCGIPPLLIQVFVENSIKHTIDSDREIDLYIQAEQTGDKLHVGVYDNGTGFSEEVLVHMEEGLSDKKDNRFQIGLRNAMARLRLLYGQEAKVVFSNGEAGGAHVDIYIPIEDMKGEGS